jgi:hypothetical protein
VTTQRSRSTLVGVQASDMPRKTRRTVQIGFQRRPDLGVGVAPVATQGTEIGQPALLGPATHRLWGHLQKVGDLRCPQVPRLDWRRHHALPSCPAAPIWGTLRPPNTKAIQRSTHSEPPPSDRRRNSWTGRHVERVGLDPGGTTSGNDDGCTWQPRVQLVSLVRFIQVNAIGTTQGRAAQFGVLLARLSQACPRDCVGGMGPNNRQSACGATSLAACVVDASAVGS